MNCVVNPNYVCPLGVPYCPIVAPGMKYCSYANYYLDEGEEGEKE